MFLPDRFPWAVVAFDEEIALCHFIRRPSTWSLRNVGPCQATESTPLSAKAQIDVIGFGRTLQMDIPVSRSQGDFNLKPTWGLRTVGIRLGDIVEPQNGLSPRTKAAENPPDLFLVTRRNVPVRMDEIGIDRKQHHFRLIIVDRQLLRVTLQPRRLFSGSGFPLLGGFYFDR
jgi:hypothetical protein